MMTSNSSSKSFLQQRKKTKRKNTVWRAGGEDNDCWTASKQLREPKQLVERMIKMMMEDERKHSHTVASLGGNNQDRRTARQDTLPYKEAEAVGWNRKWVFTGCAWLSMTINCLCGQKFKRFKVTIQNKKLTSLFHQQWLQWFHESFPKIKEMFLTFPTKYNSAWCEAH